MGKISNPNLGLASHLQSEWEAAGEDKGARQTVISLTESFGEIAWMSCPTAEDLDGIIKNFETTDLKKAFLFGVSKSIDIPRHPPTAYGNALRPYVHKMLREL